MNLLNLILIIILLAWLSGNFIFHVGSLIHALIVLFIAVLIYKAITGREVL